MNNQLYPALSQLLYPDGAVFIYAQAASDIKADMLIALNPNKKVVPYSGGGNLPDGIVIEDVDKDAWTFIKVKDSQQQPSRMIKP